MDDKFNTTQEKLSEDQESDMPPQISVGEVVLYVLGENDATQINRRRTNVKSISGRMVDGEWPKGAQAHVGNIAHAGDAFPMIIVHVWNQDPGTVNGQVFLDGSDVLWVTSVVPGSTPGTWRYQ